MPGPVGSPDRPLCTPPLAPPPRPYPLQAAFPTDATCPLPCGLILSLSPPRLPGAWPFLPRALPTHSPSTRAGLRCRPAPARATRTSRLARSRTSGHAGAPHGPAVLPSTCPALPAPSGGRLEAGHLFPGLRGPRESRQVAEWSPDTQEDGGEPQGLGEQGDWAHVQARGRVGVEGREKVGGLVSDHPQQIYPSRAAWVSHLLNPALHPLSTTPLHTDTRTHMHTCTCGNYIPHTHPFAHTCVHTHTPPHTVQRKPRQAGQSPGQAPSPRPVGGSMRSPRQRL